MVPRGRSDLANEPQDAEHSRHDGDNSQEAQNLIFNLGHGNYPLPRAIPQKAGCL